MLQKKLQEQGREMRNGKIVLNPKLNKEKRVDGLQKQVNKMNKKLKKI